MTKISDSTANEIVNLFERRHLSYRKIAHRLGVSPGTICNVLNKHRNLKKVEYDKKQRDAAVEEQGRKQCVTLPKLKFIEKHDE